MINSWNHTNKSSKSVYAGKYLEVFVTSAADKWFWFIDVLYKNSDVGLTYYEAQTASEKDEAILRAKAFVSGYDYARDEFVEWAKNPEF